MKKYLKEDWPLYLIFLGVLFVITKKTIESLNKPEITYQQDTPPDYWEAPSLFLDNTLEGEERKTVIYGQDIVAYTSRYFGPHGTVLQISNGMNCQNCH